MKWKIYYENKRKNYIDVCRSYRRYRRSPSEWISPLGQLVSCLGRRGEEGEVQLWRVVERCGEEGVLGCVGEVWGACGGRELAW